MNTLPHREVLEPQRQRDIRCLGAVRAALWGNRLYEKRPLAGQTHTDNFLDEVHTLFEECDADEEKGIVILQRPKAKPLRFSLNPLAVEYDVQKVFSLEHKPIGWWKQKDSMTFNPARDRLEVRREVGSILVLGFQASYSGELPAFDDEVKAVAESIADARAYQQVAGLQPIVRVANGQAA